MFKLHGSITRFAGAPIVVALCIGSAWGQSSATITGFVKSSKGAVVEGVRLTLTGARTAEKRTAQTDAEGAFTIPQLAPDEYRIDAACDACADLSTLVEVGAGQQRRVDLEVNLDSASTTIALDTKATTIDATSGRLGSNVTAAEMAGLPVNGGTYSPLELGAPGAVNGGAASFGDIRFHGQSVEQNRFTVDGVDSSSVVSASPGFTAAPGFQFRLRTSVDSIQEFRVDTAGTGANEGGVTGAQIHLVSKSGEDAWHGSLFEYFRNTHLNKANYFDEQRSPLHLNQFGGIAGGRLERGRIFVLGSFEELRQRAGFDILERTPSAEALAEAHPAIAAIATAFPAGQSMPGDIDGVARRATSARQDENSYALRFDYVASANSRFFVRAQRSSGDLNTPDQTASTRSILANLRSNHVVASWKLTAGSFIHEFVGGWNSSPTVMSASSEPALLASTRIFVGETSGGFASPGGLTMLPNGDLGAGAEYRGRSYQFGDHVTWLHGQHTVEAGGDFRVMRAPIRAGGGTSVHYQDIGGLLENEDADLTLIGDLTSHVAAREEYSGYVHDNWRVSPSFTLNLGMRYEYFGAVREIDGRARLFDLGSYEFRSANSGFYRPSRTGFAPRVGFAWSPTRLKGNTVVRFGAGVYQGTPSLLDMVRPISNDSDRYVLIGANFPMTPSAIEHAEDAQLAPLGFDVSGFSHMLRNYQATFSVQQMLPGKFVAQVATVASVSRHLEQFGAANLTVGVDPITGHPHRAHDDVAAISVAANGGRSSYNSLQLGLTRRFVDELTFNAAYNWSHSIGNTEGSGDASLPQNPNCLACERSDNNFDVRHTLHTSLLYALPFGRGRRHLNQGPVAAIAGGWSLGSIWNYRSGLPVNVTINRPDEIWQNIATGEYYGGDDPGFGARPMVNTPGGGEGRPALRPNLVAGVDPYLYTGANFWLNPAAFAAPLPGTFGNLGRNALRGPNFSQFDLQLTRTFTVSEGKSFNFRAEAFNLFNQVNFANPVAVLPDMLDEVSPGHPYPATGGGGFGIISSTLSRTVGLGASRQVQLSLRYRF